MKALMENDLKPNGMKEYTGMLRGGERRQGEQEMTWSSADTRKKKKKKTSACCYRKEWY